MNGANRPWIIGTVFVMIVALVGGWFLGIQPQLAAASTANADRTNIEDNNDLAQLELARLKAQDKALPRLKKDLAKVQESIPDSGLLEEYTAQLSRMASANGLTLSNVDYSGAQPFTPTPEFEALVPMTVDPAKLIVITLTWTVVGSRDGVNNFIKAVQDGTRLTIVSQFTSATGPDGLSWGMDAQGSIFVLLDEAPVDPSAVVDPTATAAPTPTPSAAP